MDQTVHKPELPEYVVIGIITKPHGIRGALKVEPMTDDPERFKILESVYLSKSDNDKQLYHITGIQPGNKQLIITFKEIQNRNDAELLRGYYVEIPRSECIPLDEGSFYYFELLGFKVQTDKGLNVGVLDNILEYPANDMFVIKDNDKELLIPVVDEFIDNIDVDLGIITIKPIDGLLEQ